MTAATRGGDTYEPGSTKGTFACSSRASQSANVSSRGFELSPYISANEIAIIC